MSSATTSPVADRLARLYAFDDEMIADPFPLYRAMRADEPVVRVASVVAVSRYADIKAVFKDTARFSNNRWAGSRVTERRARLHGEDLARYDYLIEGDKSHPGQLDGEAHTRMRRFVNALFSAAAIDAMRASLENFAEEMLDRVDETSDDVFDLTEFSFAFPFNWMCRLLGGAEVDTDQFKRWAYEVRLGLGSNYENIDPAYDATREIESWVLAHIAERRGNPGASDDLMSQLVNSEVGGSVLSDRELVTLFTVMLTTGNTNDMICNAVVALDAHPDQRRELAEQPHLFRGAVEEFFRYCPAAHSVHRVAAVDTDIAGFPVRQGETIRLIVASGNHDDTVFPEPERLDVRRANARQHLDLGYGIHTCLGQWLARLEIDVALRALYRRYPRLSVAAPVTYRSNYQFHGPTRLLVTATQ